MKTNLYIKALEIGYESGEKGISYEDITEKLESLGYSINTKLFRSWFYRNFEHDTLHKILLNAAYGAPENSNKIDEKPLRIWSDSVFKYLEYVELKEARINSLRANTQSIEANRQSRLAIRIGICGVLIGVIMPLFLLFIGKTQNVSIESVKDPIFKSTEKTIQQSIEYANDNQIQTQKLLLELSVKQDSLIKIINQKK